MRANYHTHTTRCKHAKGEDREYIETAIKAGIEVLGFSDHCPWIFEDPTYVSGTRMFPDQLEEYVTTMQDFKKEYAKDITLYVGLESEYIKDLLPMQAPLLRDLPIDYQILGPHFLVPENRGPYMGFQFVDPSMLTAYVDSCIEAMETGNYKYIAHPDIIQFLGDHDHYHKEMGRLCQYLSVHNIPVEINMLGVAEKRHYTSRRFLQIAKEQNCSCIIGADAHFPERLNRDYEEAACIALAKEFDLPIVAFLPGLGPR